MATFFDKQFPAPQYLGAKYIIKDWIKEYVPNNCNRCLDAFGGSQSIAFMLKQMGKEVLTNDFMMFSSEIGKALIENTDITLDKRDVEILFSENKNPSEYNLIEEIYSNLFFIPSEAAFLDSFRSNIEYLNNDYKKALAFSIMCRTLTRKITMGHFAHTQALKYANNDDRIKRNRSLIRPIKDIFMELLPQYNAAVFDNGKMNKSYNKNILDLLPSLTDVDFVYFDPPYCDSHADYQSFYHLLETFVTYWKDKNFINSIRRYEPQRYSGFDKKKDVIQSFQQLFDAAKNIPVWILSYNDRSYPNIDMLTKLIIPYKNVDVVKKPYNNSRGGKGSVAGSNELLFICTEK